MTALGSTFDLALLNAYVKQLSAAGEHREADTYREAIEKYETAKDSLEESEADVRALARVIPRRRMLLRARGSPSWHRSALSPDRSQVERLQQAAVVDLPIGRDEIQRDLFSGCARMRRLAGRSDHRRHLSDFLSPEQAVLVADRWVQKKASVVKVVQRAPASPPSQSDECMSPTGNKKFGRSGFQSKAKSVSIQDDNDLPKSRSAPPPGAGDGGARKRPANLSLRGPKNVEQPVVSPAGTQDDTVAEESMHQDRTVASSSIILLVQTAALHGFSDGAAVRIVGRGVLHESKTYFVKVLSPTSVIVFEDPQLTCPLKLGALPVHGELVAASQVQTSAAGNGVVRSRIPSMGARRTDRIDSFADRKFGDAAPQVTIASNERVAYEAEEPKSPHSPGGFNPWRHKPERKGVKNAKSIGCDQVDLFASFSTVLQGR
mmetsp:Transcript_53455/g.142012  ORF Transcript_53455/g.142012 Transcript_53455/m.142012 type:complete len:433 (+) Transcript_53455:58-1356(+)